MKKFIIAAAAILATSTGIYMYNNQPAAIKITDAKDHLEVPFAHYEIIDENGDLVAKSTTDETGTIDASILEKGSYYIKTTVAGYSETIKKVSIGLFNKTINIALQ